MNRRDLIKTSIGTAIAGVTLQAAVEETAPTEVPITVNSTFSAADGITADSMYKLSAAANADDCALYNQLHGDRVKQLYARELLRVQKAIQNYAMTGHTQLEISLCMMEMTIGGDSETYPEISAVIIMIDKKLTADGFRVTKESLSVHNTLYNSLFIRWFPALNG